MTTRAITVTSVPVDLRAALSLVNDTLYSCQNVSASETIFAADANSAPAAGSPAYHIFPGEKFTIKPESGIASWAWCDAGQQAEIVIGPST